MLGTMSISGLWVKGKDKCSVALTYCDSH